MSSGPDFAPPDDMVDAANAWEKLVAHYPDATPAGIIMAIDTARAAVRKPNGVVTNEWYYDAVPKALVALDSLGRADGYRLFVNQARTVFVRLWRSGTCELATRDDPAHTWGPPSALNEERGE